MFAVVNIAGKQYRVAQGDQVKVSSLETEAGKKVKFDQVLLTDDGKKVQVGTPTLKGVTVSGTVLNHGRDRKVIIFKKREKNPSANEFICLKTVPPGNAISPGNPAPFIISIAMFAKILSEFLIIESINFSLSIHC